MSMELRAMKLKQLIVGWIGYVKLADMKSALRELDFYYFGSLFKDIDIVQSFFDVVQENL